MTPLTILRSIATDRSKALIISCVLLIPNVVFSGLTSLKKEYSYLFNFKKNIRSKVNKFAIKIQQEEMVDKLSLFRAVNFDLNFGVVVHNEHFTIYRSGCLGKTKFEDLRKHTQVHKIPFPKSILYMNKYGYGDSRWYARFFPEKVKLQNFAHQQEEAIQNNNQGADKITFYHPLAMNECDQIYLDGKNPFRKRYSDPIIFDSIVNEDTKAYYLAKGSDVNFSDNFHTGGVDDLLKILDIILVKAKSPILIHCKAGRHRTGMIIRAIREIQGGIWTKPFAIPFEVIARKKYVQPVHLKLKTWADIEYYLHNHKDFRKENLKIVESLKLVDSFRHLVNAHKEQLNTEEESRESSL